MQPWKKPQATEISMGAEIGGYQNEFDDDRGRDPQFVALELELPDEPEGQA